MTSLCSNRPEGLRSTSTITPHLPSQCFFDVILVPLPTWIYLISISLLLISPSHKTHYAATDQPPTVLPPPRPWVRRIPAAIYYFLIGVVVLMETVEIARLARAQLGVGLLPFVYVGCLAAVALRVVDSPGRLRGRAYYWVHAASAVFWAVGLGVTAAKLAALARLGATALLGRTGTAYPVADQVTDLVVLVVFYLLLVGAEVGLTVMRRRTLGRSSGGDGKGVVVVS